VAAILAAIGDYRNVSASLDHRGSSGAETLRSLLA
jgi:hypothetical protein